MKIFEWFKDFFESDVGWEEIKSIPSWAIRIFRKEFNRNYVRGNRNPYNKNYYIKGKSFLYKVKVTDNTQGGCYYYYRKLRNK